MNLRLTFIIFLFPFFMFAQPDVELQILTAVDGIPDDMFGESVGVSGDFLVVGMPQDDEGDSNTGSVYIYKKNGFNWSVSQKLTVADGELADMFGISVAIDGNYLVVGAWQAVGVSGNTGAAYVYKYNGTTWEFKTKIFADDGGGADNFGRSVAINGNNIVVGAPNEDFGSGCAYVFQRTDENWNQVIKLVEDDEQMMDHFGQSVGISGDFIVCGAYQNNADGVSNTGAAYVFYNNLGTWEQHSKLVSDDVAPDDNLGYSVAIDGDYIIVGSHVDDGGKGAAYVFYNNSGTWEQQAKLTASDGMGEDYFGKAVSISGDYILVPAQKHNETKADEGAAYLFKRTGANWSQTKKFIASDASDTGIFGYTVAIENDFAFISSTQENGSVYVFGPEGVDVKSINDEIYFYPNPANSIISFSEENISQVKVYDFSGKDIDVNIIYNNKIDISNLNVGIYFVELQINNKLLFGKFIKQ